MENSRHCAICKKTPEQVTLYRGVLKVRIVDVCEECAEDQKIPIIKKPSQSQLSQINKTYSVRERLDRMSGRRVEERELLTTQRNLAKLKMPKPKQNHPDVLDNYYWTLSMARRRAKMTTSQLAKKIRITATTVQGVERGVIPEDFKDIFPRFENVLNIKLLKNHDSKISFIRKNSDKEKEILNAVKEKMGQPASDRKEKKIVRNRTAPEDEGFKDKGISEDVTLSDLIDRKRAREKYNLKMKQEEMFGDDIDLDSL